jgi:hypothetical protein
VAGPGEHAWARAEANVEAGQAGLRTRPRSEVRGPLRRKKHFSFYFQILSPQIPILNKLEPFSRLDSKIKIAQNFMIINFAKKSKAKIQIDFELEI